MIENYARAAFAAGWAEIGPDAFPIHVETIVMMRCAIATAEEFADRPGILQLVREAGKREALLVVLRRRRDALDARSATAQRPLLRKLGRQLGPHIANALLPKETAVAPDPRDVVASTLAGQVSAADWAEWSALLTAADQGARAEGNVAATALLASARGEPLPSFDITFSTALDAIQAMPGVFEGAQTWLEKITAGLAYSVGGDLADAIASGSSWDDLLAIVQQGFAAGDNGAELALNGMLTQGMSTGSLDQYTAEGLAECEILVSADACDECLGLEAQNPWPVSEAQDLLEVHPNCFPAGTLIAGPSVQAVTSRPHKGELVTIETASGDRLTGTPNHPILTPRGWVALGDLREGDDLFRCSDAERVALAVDPHEHQGVARIEDVASAVGVTFQRVPVAAADFHGDGIADSQVDVVLADGFGHDHASIRQAADHLGERELVGAGVAPVALFAERSSAQVGVAAMHTANGGVGSVRQCSALLRGERGHPHVHRRAASAWLDPGREQPPADPASVDAQALAERLLGLSAGVTVDQIRHVERVASHGRVYNLQTAEGWFVAAGIIVSNCRCGLGPVVAGASQDGG